ncbi:unnamed protein product [Protopolystoma xenopodis]|uniref:Uncharacterized protein n=1 Tax=Protopolystoma xenopodis TaxID=117903 RepID=A0A448X6D8_9PLAT|nr:unnamed protein product [Protopolystoma xenopodis]
MKLAIGICVQLRSVRRIACKSGGPLEAQLDRDLEPRDQCEVGSSVYTLASSRQVQTTEIQSHRHPHVFVCVHVCITGRICCWSVSPCCPLPVSSGSSLPCRRKDGLSAGRSVGCWA